MSRTHFYTPGPKHVRDPRLVFNRYNSKLTPAEIAETMHHYARPLHTSARAWPRTTSMWCCTPSC